MYRAQGDSRSAPVAIFTVTGEELHHLVRAVRVWHRREAVEEHPAVMFARDPGVT